ncbi:MULTISPECIES: aminotransferase [Rhizobium/Agrobacterium group]|uniref:Aminotransferase n=2 Tax=Rhizobium/Agrobacterium group TaxID=227290 RepID=B9K3J5_ALLAM|nr:MULTISPECIES: aminotransferase [Rhizobium/Agrobacterium group]ACM39443.1 aminotransferase [Allorhizobium ampelinum S4]OHZ33794.1 aminotransferase [Agrobacterium vitis]OVE89450.1 aspartate aminotransferase family protein [Allorhizobium ampelinum]BCH68040.1 aspartate aminotransferase family protein [Agrobacterium vitis]
MSMIPNSSAARDVRFHLHAQTNPERHEGEGPLVIAKADGPYIFDDAGTRYLDVMAGLWCASLGFTNDGLAKAASDAYATMGFYHTFGGRASPAVIDAAEAIAQLVPLDDARVFFATSGSEAIETMVKIAWLYHAANGAPQRRKIIARQRAFHGSTIFAASLTGLPHMHREFGLPLEGVVHTLCPDPYREQRKDETTGAFVERLANELEALILAEGADRIAAFIAEPINAGAGVIVPPSGYFERIQAVLDKYGILCLDDEIVCGFGRTGNWFGCQTVGMMPDMMAMAKGLSSSFFPISAVAVSGKIYEAIKSINRDGSLFGHGFTNSGHPVGAAIVTEAIRQYQSMELPRWVQQRGQMLRAKIEPVLAACPYVGQFRGEGLLLAAELVANQETKEPFAAAFCIPQHLQRIAMQKGLMLRPQGNSITFCPPFIIDDAQIDFIVDALLASMKELEQEVISKLPAAG